MEDWNNWQLNPGASADCIRAAESRIGFLFPLDYVAFLRRNDGGEGFVGENYLILWKVEELDVFNREYQVEKYAPGITIFGSNGGGEGYGFDRRDTAMPIVRIPFVGMELCYALRVAGTFTELLTVLEDPA